MRHTTHFFLTLFAVLGLATIQLSAQHTAVKHKAKTPAKNSVPSLKIFSKEITHEMVVEKNAIIQLDNSTRNLEIRTWPESKVKLIANVSVEEKYSKFTEEELLDKYCNISDEQMLKESGIYIKNLGTRLNIQSRTVTSKEFNHYVTTGVPALTQEKYTTGSTKREPETIQRARMEKEISVYATNPGQSSTYSSQGEPTRITIQGKISATMTLFIPENAELDIDNKNTDIVIHSDINKGSFKLTRTNLDARNFKYLHILGQYFNVNIGDADDAELELESGNFNAGAIRSLDLDSKNAEVDYESGSTLYLRSQHDHVTVDEIGNVDGRKLYGELRIGKLLKGIDLDGTNADIKIRNILPTVSLVKIKDQYADLRIPVKSLQNYSVTFYGANATVFTPFEKFAKVDPADSARVVIVEGIATKPTSPVTTKLTGKTTEGKEVVFTAENVSGILREKSPARFTGTAGSTSGTHTKFDITCHQCSVDFK